VQLNRRYRYRRPDAGFTLIELLVSIMLVGLVVAALGSVVIAYSKHAGATSDRLALSHDAQISATYFARDVASVGMHDYTVASTASGPPFLPSIQLDAAYDAGGQVCGTAATPVAKLRLLSDDWDHSGAAPAAGIDVVAYYLRSTGTASELHRIKCVGSTAPVSDVTLAHYVDPATIVVACSSTCTGASVPQQVTLSFTVVKPTADPYPISLSGQRRQT
jgi:prepilin-type N-terminal cleavage/methylation domain-containing protein